MFGGQFTQALPTLPGTRPLNTLQTMLWLLMKEKPDNYNDCVAWDKLTWQDLFHNQIDQLLHYFPPDQVQSTARLYSKPVFNNHPTRQVTYTGVSADFSMSQATQYSNQQNYIKAFPHYLVFAQLEKQKFQKEHRLANLSSSLVDRWSFPHAEQHLQEHQLPVSHLQPRGWRVLHCTWYWDWHRAPEHEGHQGWG